MKILIFIVAYNAEKTIESVLKRIPEAMRQYDTEVLIIDDASGDRTWQRADEFGRSGQFPFKLTVLVNPVNQGYGGNQKLGFLYAIKNGYDIVALVHGDGQYAPEALPMLVQPIVEGHADAVFGSRMMTALGALKGGMPLYKYVGNRILTTFQNLVLQSFLSEFHTGYRIYSTKALARVPFQFNTNDFHFDTEIIIQLLLAKCRIKELPIPTFYGDEVCHVDGMKYALDVAVVTTIARLQSFELMYRRNFDLSTTDGSEARELRATEKLEFDSSYSRPESLIPAGSKVLDIGGNARHLLGKLKAKGCTIIGVGGPQTNAAGYDQYFEHDLSNPHFPVKFEQFDFALMLDVIQYEKHVEGLIANLLAACSATRKIRFIITSGNVGFFVTRLMLLLGQFNYGKRGILDQSHSRLFTFDSLRVLLESSGFEVLKSEGVPVPFPLAVRNQSFARFLLGLNSALIKLRKGFFSFEIVTTARPWPSLEYVLSETTSFSASRLNASSNSTEEPGETGTIRTPARVNTAVGVSVR
jgi:glycosyltransferase involved in cell wall biosynthesis